MTAEAESFAAAGLQRAAAAAATATEAEAAQAKLGVEFRAASSKKRTKLNES